MNRHSDRLLSERMRGASQVFAVLMLMAAGLVVIAIAAGTIIGRAGL